VAGTCEATRMSDFTLKNLMEIDNALEGRTTDVEARFSRSHIESEHLGVSHFRYAPNFRSPIGHRHREQEEAYVVVAGSGRALLDDQTVELKQWDVLRVAPQMVRSFEAGAAGLELIAVGSDRPEGGDGEQMPADWPA
jgi:mannose-6-phosphate isomerase-like protein (cupin superfamily)